MKVLNFENGGRPLVNDDLQTLQANSELRSEAWLKGLGVSGAFVLDGCELTQVSGDIYNLSEGVVFVNGKIVDVPSSDNLDLSVNLYIALASDEPSGERLHENGESLPATLQRVVVIVSDEPSEGQSIELQSGKQPIKLRQVLDNLSLPIGALLMTDSFAGFDLGTGLGSGFWQGWAVCDGRNNTPDLRGRFVVGYHPQDSDYNSLGDIGGEKRHQLSINEMPSHTHSNGVFNRLLTANGLGTTRGVDDSTGEPNITTSGALQSRGGNLAHENRPPYYTLLYVKKIS